MKKINIELLAPAGSKESFIGAINAGANAVYLAGKSFGARKFANNFTNEEIAELIKYAHNRNVKVFVTINTLIFEKEVVEVFAYADYLVQNKVDALIIQDLGIIEQFVNRYPDTEIHASTQMNVYNKEQLRYLKEIGVARVILARETSTREIIELNKEIQMDLEVFIHGALCVSYSGNCYFSVFNGGRSGNRGECAQPCRLPYMLEKNGEITTDEAYLMSTKDLMSIKHLKEILESGVTSLKIEGRMRKAEYVIATVRAYKEALNHIEKETPFDLQRRIDELMQVFNREYTKGYISQEMPYDINNSYRPNHQGLKVGTVLKHQKGKVTIRLTNTLHKNDGIRIIGQTDVGGKVNRIIKDREIVTTAKSGDIIQIDMLGTIEPGSIVRKTLDIALNDSLQDYLSKNYKLTSLQGSLHCFVGKPLTLTIRTPFSSSVTIQSDFIIEQANNPTQDKDKIYNQFNKLGNTHYYLSNFRVETDGKGFIPNSVLNNIRREAIRQLQDSYKSSNTINPTKSLQLIPTTTKSVELIVKVDTLDQYNAAKKLGIETIYYNEKLIEITPRKTDYIYMNRIWKNRLRYRNNNIVINDFGGIQLGKNTVANHFINTTNSYTMYSLYKRGINRITLSTEIDFDILKNQLDSFKRQFNYIPQTELIVYGKPDLMISKYCPITKSENINKLNCNLCENNNYSLIDTSKNKYLIKRDYECNVRIIHHKPINLEKQLTRFISLGITHLRLDFTDEPNRKTEEIINKFKRLIKN